MINPENPSISYNRVQILVELTRTLPANFKGSLPSIEEIEETLVRFLKQGEELTE